jgi:hypothetical protein
MDIVQNILGFGTNDSTTYGLSKNAAKKIIQWASEPSKMVSEMVKALGNALTKFKDEVTAAIASFKSPAPAKSATESDKKKEFTDLFDKFFAEASNVLDKTVRKYLEEIKGITRALSGAPSTPWHITIGNPLRPIFCSGDMITEEVTLSLGPTLAFNDLPSNIKVEFTLKNARPLGLQEIMGKFNTGNVRVVDVRMDSSQIVVPLTQNTYMQDQGLSASTTDGLLSGSQSSSSPRTDLAGVTQSSTKENSTNVAVNPDPNSQNITI